MKSKKSIDHTKFLKYIPNNQCKNVSDEVDRNITLENNNIIPDVIIKDDEKILKKSSLSTP